MPDKKYWDKQKKKEVVLPSDYFECNRCLGSDFAYEINPAFVSGESTKEFKQICKKCGEVFYSDKKYQIDEPDRYELASVREKRMAKEAEAKTKEARKKELEKERKEAKAKNSKTKPKTKTKKK